MEPQSRTVVYTIQIGARVKIIMQKFSLIPLSLVLVSMLSACSEEDVIIDPAPPPSVDAQGSFHLLAEDSALNDQLVITTSDRSSLSLELLTPPEHGEVVFVSNSEAFFRYTPDPDYHGTDHFVFRAHVSDNISADARVDLSITPVNDRPTANDDSGNLDQNTALDINVLSNDSDFGDSPISISISHLATHGQVVVNPDNSIRYTADSDYYGDDSFQYTLTDADGEQSTALVNITVRCTNGCPSATLEWPASTEPGILGYYLHQGQVSGSYDLKQWLGNVTRFSLEDYSAGTYFFAVSAVSAQGESALSPVRVVTID